MTVIVRNATYKSDALRPLIFVMMEAMEGVSRELGIVLAGRNPFALDRVVCRMCGECWKICPAGAITPEEKPLCFDYCRCIRCYCCIEACLFGALDIAEIIAGRIIRGAASLILPPGKTR
jgi:ferredoxin